MRETLGSRKQINQNKQEIKVMNQSQFSLHLLSPMKKIQQTSMMRKVSRIQDNIKVIIAVWNLQGMIPPANSIKRFMSSLIEQEPDLICISTQQCQRSIAMSFCCENKDEWENCLRQTADGYSIAVSETMSALHMAILVKEDLTSCFTVQNRMKMRAGACNLFGNKGAISLIVNLLGQSFQFINCHLQAHQNQAARRNEVLLRISDQIVSKDYRTQIFICGDLNYRIDMVHEQYYALVKNKVNTDKVMRYSKMLQKDQLYLQKQLQQKFFPFFKEDPIKFPPTYKIDDQTQEYDKSRIPGWTDRIFHRKGRSRQTKYDCLYELNGTDHRPVLASYTLDTEQTLSIFPEDFVAVKTRGSCALI